MADKATTKFEELLGKYTGAITTIINSSHYPDRLVNKPPSGPIRTLNCSCNHLQFCKLCELKGDVSDKRLTRRS